MNYDLRCRIYKFAKRCNGYHRISSGSESIWTNVERLSVWHLFICFIHINFLLLIFLIRWGQKRQRATRFHWYGFFVLFAKIVFFFLKTKKGNIKYNGLHWIRYGSWNFYSFLLIFVSLYRFLPESKYRKEKNQKNDKTFYLFLIS